MRLFLLLLFVVFTTLACTERNSNSSETEKEAVNRVFVNGKIYTVNEKQTWAEAVYVKDGIIRFVGKSDEARKMAGSDAEVIDLEGKMMMPGIHDVHIHPLEAMSSYAGACTLNSDETDAENYFEVLNECQDDQTASTWVLGSGHSLATLLEAERQPVEILDDAVPDRPAVIIAETAHSVWVNSKALELAKIDKDTPDPVGGIIVKDPESGKPTGILFDSAGDMFVDLAWQPTKEIQELNYNALLDSQNELSKNGITSVTEGRTYWKREFEKAWLRAERERKLNVRAVLALWAYPGMDDDTQIRELKSRFRANKDGIVQVSQIKIYSDGVLTNSTAALLEPYNESLSEVGLKNGLNYFDEERIAKYVSALESEGFDFLVHAIGDRGVRESLNAFEKAGKGDGRHRITHLEVVDTADFGRFKELNITADMQVAGDYTQPANWKEMDGLLGERAKNLIPLKSIADSGARLTLSSDWDVSTINPFVGMENALTRSPQNLSELSSVVRAYTINAAYSMRQEERTGSIEVGKLADLIVLNQNIFEIETDDISTTEVIMTFLAGRKVFSRDV